MTRYTIVTVFLFLFNFGVLDEANAVPITVGSFSGSETYIDFDSLANNTVVTNQFAGSGVLFNSPTAEAFPTAFVGDSDPNQIYNRTNQDIELTFSVPTNRIGAYVSHETGLTVTLTIYDDLNLPIESVVSSFSVPVGGTFPEGFLGLEANVNISRAVFVDTLSQFMIDDLRFEVIPEPTTLTLTALGLLGMGCCRRKRV